MTKYWLLFIIFLSNFAQSQDTLVSLTINPYLPDRVAVKKSTNTADSTFKYTYANLDLPVFDDFSINRWLDYITDFTAPNVSSVLFFKIFDGSTTPIPLSQEMCDSTLARTKTVIIAGTTVIDSVYTNFTTGIPLFIDDLNTQEPEANPILLYNECFTLIDTVIDGILTGQQDTIFHQPNFVQDSARVFTANLTNDDIWLDDFACHNYRFAFEPKSLGVATFDGVGDDGFPYEFGGGGAYGRADVLTSKPINLLGKTNVFLSFLYQAKGFGNSPEGIDSLRLEFYSPQLESWFTLWSTGGDVPDNEWQTAHVEVSASTFLRDGFQFRFSNNASLAGQLDHWHIDYVNLRENSSPDDTIIDDLAISYPIESLLEDYTAVPWDHYNNLTDPNAKMKAEYELLVKNNHTAAKITNAGQLEVDGNTFSLPVATPNWVVGNNVYTFGVGSQPYHFLQNTAVDKEEFDVKVNISTSTTNLITENDTTYFTQQFKNYYAYDDGTAENGYGIVDNNAQIAYQFEAYEADTLTGLLMKFIPNLTDVTGNIILLTVWADDNGQPGEIIYKDDFFQPSFPDYAPNKGQYSYYRFNDNQMVPVPEKFYVGFEQIQDNNLYLGMDMNNNNQDRIFFNTGGSWSTSSFTGSLIMRPVFSTRLNYTLDVPPAKAEELSFNMYPNPVINQLTIDNLPPNHVVKIYDLAGKQVFSENKQIIDFSSLTKGFYIVTINDSNGKPIYNEKIIKQ